MKRAAFSLAGVVYGLFLTWLCLYIFSHIEWPQSDKPATGCHELGECPVPWWSLALLFVDVLASPMLFGILNAVAWKRWSIYKWGWYFGGLTVATAAYRLAGYAL